MPLIKIKIDQTGNVKAEGEGFTGGACRAAMKPILDRFAGGKGNVESKEKPEAALLDTESDDTLTVSR